MSKDGESSTNEKNSSVFKNDPNAIAAVSKDVGRKKSSAC